MIEIPIQIENKEYYSFKQHEIQNMLGEKIAVSSIAVPLQIDICKKKLNNESRAIEKIRSSDIIKYFKKAASYFKDTIKIGKNNISYDEHINMVVNSTGLPIKYVKEGEAVIYYYLNNIESILKAQIPDGNLDTLDRGYYIKEKKKIGWIREKEIATVILPSNNPSIHTIWLTALALKMQLILKPSFEDVFTPIRIIAALKKAGFPTEHIGFMPMNHEDIFKLLKVTSKNIIFGSQEIIEKLKPIVPDAKFYGPGSSKLYIDNINSDLPQEKLIKHTVDGIMSYGGKGCVSLSGVVVRSNGMEFAKKVAKKLSEISIEPIYCEKAQIPAIKEKKLYERLIKYIKYLEGNGAINISSYYDNNFNIIQDKYYFIRPIVMYVKSDNPMFGLELPFPFVTVTETKDESEAKKILKGTLSLSLIGVNEEFDREMIFEPSILMLHRGFNHNVSDVDPEKPFEGYISEYLYKVKAL